MPSPQMSVQMLAIGLAGGVQVHPSSTSQSPEHPSPDMKFPSSQVSPESSTLLLQENEVTIRLVVWHLQRVGGTP